MTDIAYRQTKVPDLLVPIFESLCVEFPEYETWVRLEDFGRWLSAGVVNRDTGVAVTIPLKRGGRIRAVSLQLEEISKIRQHLAANQPDDLQLDARLG